MADGDEDAVDREGLGLAGQRIAQHGPGDRGRHVVAGDVGELGVPAYLDLGMLEQPVLQNAFGSELAAAVDHGHLGREVGEEQRFLDGSVAAAHHKNMLLAIEEAVAGRAGTYAKALKL
jgi:hypothetical protein